MATFGVGTPNWRGLYSSTATYAVGDLVAVGNAIGGLYPNNIAYPSLFDLTPTSLYVAIAAGVLPPPLQGGAGVSAAYWRPLLGQQPGCLPPNWVTDTINLTITPGSIATWGVVTPQDTANVTSVLGGPIEPGTLREIQPVNIQEIYFVPGGPWDFDYQESVNDWPTGFWDTGFFAYPILAVQSASTFTITAQNGYTALCGANPNGVTPMTVGVPLWSASIPGLPGVRIGNQWPYGTYSGLGVWTPGAGRTWTINLNVSTKFAMQYVVETENSLGVITATTTPALTATLTTGPNQYPAGDTAQNSALVAYADIINTIHAELASDFTGSITTGTEVAAPTADPFGAALVYGDIYGIDGNLVNRWGEFTFTDPESGFVVTNVKLNAPVTTTETIDGILYDVTYSVDPLVALPSEYAGPWVSGAPAFMPGLTSWQASTGAWNFGFLGMPAPFGIPDSDTVSTFPLIGWVIRKVLRATATGAPYAGVDLRSSPVHGRIAIARSLDGAIAVEVRQGFSRDVEYTASMPNGSYPTIHWRSDGSWHMVYADSLGVVQLLRGKDDFRDAHGGPVSLWTTPGITLPSSYADDRNGILYLYGIVATGMTVSVYAKRQSIATGNALTWSDSSTEKAVLTGLAPGSAFSVGRSEYDTDRTLVGTIGSGLYESTDEGESWTAV